MVDLHKSSSGVPTQSRQHKDPQVPPRATENMLNERFNSGSITPVFYWILSTYHFQPFPSVVTSPQTAFWKGRPRPHRYLYPSNKRINCRSSNMRHPPPRKNNHLHIPNTTWKSKQNSKSRHSHSSILIQHCPSPFSTQFQPKGGINITTMLFDRSHLTPRQR